MLVFTGRTRQKILSGALPKDRKFKGLARFF